MEALGIIGFIFGLAALSQVRILKKTGDALNKDVEELKK